LLLQKTTRSMQRHLHDFFHRFIEQPAVSAGALTQARAKFSHRAFCELNQQLLIPAFYSPQAQSAPKQWRGHRLLGVEGSQLSLPNHEKVIERFGSIAADYKHGDTGSSYVAGRPSVLYDLLNHVGLDARLEPLSVGEVEIAIEQLSQIQPEDCVIWDRGFSGYVLMAQTLEAGANFMGRCSTRSFLAAKKLFEADHAGCSVVENVKVPGTARAAVKREKLPRELTVRFVSLRLPDGKLEVLVTSLIDEQTYPTEEFLEVYHWRWCHETYYLMLKSRLDLENWSGLTLESVQQDLQAAVLVANLENLLSQEAQEQLSAGDRQRQYPLRVDKAVSYHALKVRHIFKQAPSVRAKSRRLAALCHAFSVGHRETRNPGF
jgi:hypothetical protein